MKTQRIVEGSCHCGSLTVKLELTREAASYGPRACDCDFCRMHGASYVSDPKGRLWVRIEEDALGRYRQGAHRADMLFCLNCGVLIGACYQEGPNLFAAVNARILPNVFGTEATVSPKKLGPDEKRDRWKQFWFGGVQLEDPS